MNHEIESRRYFSSEVYNLMHCTNSHFYTHKTSNYFKFIPAQGSRCLNQNGQPSGLQSQCEAGRVSAQMQRAKQGVMLSPPLHGDVFLAQMRNSNATRVRSTRWCPSVMHLLQQRVRSAGSTPTSSRRKTRTMRARSQPRSKRRLGRVLSRASRRSASSR